MKLNRILPLVPVCLFTACALQPKYNEQLAVPVIAQPAPQSETDQLLAYLMQTRKLDAREFVIEREQTRNAFQTEKSEFNRVKLALLLASIPALLMPYSANASDDTELIALLDPLVNNAGAATADASTLAQKTELRALAILMHGIAHDRKKLRDQWREAQARVNALRRDDTKDVETRALRARVEELERKLAALKSIDRSVNRRSEVPRVEPPRVESPK